MLERKFFVLFLKLMLQRKIFFRNLHNLALFNLLFQYRDLRIIVGLLDKDFVLFLLQILDGLLGVRDTTFVLLKLRLNLHLPEAEVHVEF